MSMLVPLTDRREIKQQLELFEFDPIDKPPSGPEPPRETIEENAPKEVVLTLNKGSVEEDRGAEPSRLSSAQQEMIAHGLPIAFGSKKKIKKR